MKNLCLECEIGCKIELCCSSHPATGESVPLNLNNGQKVMACPNLDADESCSVYHLESMPQACREYFCYKYNEMPLTDLFT